MNLLRLRQPRTRWWARLTGSAALGLTLAVAALMPVGTSLAAARATCTQVSCVIAFGDAAITARNSALNTLQTKVTNQLTAQHITQDQANVVDGDVSTNLSGLAALKSKLDAETQMAPARMDVHNIYYQFRIFAVVLPRDYHHLWLDVLVQVDGKMRAAEPKIQDAINAIQGLPDKDGDKEKLNAAFADFKNQLPAAEGQIDGAQGLLPTLTPSSFDTTPATYKTNFTDYVNDIHTAHGDLRTAAKDLHTIAQALKDLVGDQGAANPAPTATTTGA
jgi:hypothetical protein